MSKRFATFTFLFLCFHSILYAEECGGSLIGQNIYTIQNDTNIVQYVFISPTGTVSDAKSWKRITLLPGDEIANVEYYEGRFALVVNVLDGKKQAKKYEMECKRRYLLRRDMETGSFNLFKLD